jgi:Na+-driven multidrug efflux pump
MIATISWMWVNGIVIVVLRSSFISVFLREEDRTPEVVQILNSVLVITGAACVMDGIQVVAGSIVRAVGNPMVGTIVGLIAHYIFTLPLGGALALNGVGLNGLWYGLTSTHLSDWCSFHFTPRD